MRNIDKNDDPATIYWRLEQAYKNDPLIQMLSENVRNGLARAFFNWSVYEDEIVLCTAESNIRVGIRHIMANAPLAWVGQGFTNHIEDVTVAALIPEG